MSYISSAYDIIKELTNDDVYITDFTAYDYTGA